MKEVVRTMKKSDVNWCTCKDYHNWDVLAEYYFLHFVPNSWVFKYRTLTEHEEGRVLYITGVCNRCGGFMRSGTSVPANICGDELLRHVKQRGLQRFFIQILMVYRRFCSFSFTLRHSLEPVFPHVPRLSVAGYVVRRIDALEVTLHIRNEALCSTLHFYLCISPFVPIDFRLLFRYCVACKSPTKY